MGLLYFSGKIIQMLLIYKYLYGHIIFFTFIWLKYECCERMNRYSYSSDTDNVSGIIFMDCTYTNSFVFLMLF